MERKQGSGSAAVVAFFRAVETVRVQPLLTDEFALSLSPAVMQRALAHPIGLRAALTFFDPRFGPGKLQTWVAMRHRWIDDRVRDFLVRMAGNAQVVILGAGFDTRFLRIGRDFPDARFVEVDHPATQAAKRTALEAANIALPAFVPLDFARQRIGEAQGFDWSRPSIIVWEGVTMYLERADIGATLTDLATLGQPGSELICDFRMTPPATARAVNRVASLLLSRLGEPLRFATDEVGAEQLLAESGWRVSDHADPTSLGRALAGGTRTGLGGNFVVRATKAGS